MTAGALAAAVAAARAADWRGCLSALLAAWRPARAVEIAALVDEVSARAAGDAVAPRKVPARIAAATDADVGPIVATIARQVRTQPAFGAHATALAAARPADPRIAALLAAFFVRSPYKGDAGPLDTGILDALDAIDDPRFRHHIVAAADMYGPRRGRLVKRRARIDHLVAVAADVRARPAPPPADGDALAAIRAELARVAPAAAAAAGDRESLYAAVYASPTDDAPRLVLADALLTAGDPRGELIALQLAFAASASASAPLPGPSAAQLRRERELLAIHARPWLGAIEPLLQKSGLVYRRGFPAAARLAPDVSIAPAFALPAWHTLEDLDLVGAWGQPLADWLPTLRGLVRLSQLHVLDLPRLVERAAATGPLRWTALGLRLASRDGLARLAAHLGVLPHLAALDLSAVGIARNVLDHFPAALVAQVRCVRLAAPARAAATELPTVVAAARALGLARLELVAAYEFPPIAESPAVAFDLAAGHATITHRKPRHDARYALAILAAAPPALVRTLAIVAPPTAQPEPTTHARLDELLAARGIVVTTRPPPPPPPPPRARV